MYEFNRELNIISKYKMQVSRVYSDSCKQGRSMHKLKYRNTVFPFLVVCSFLSRLSYKFLRLFDIALCESLEKSSYAQLRLRKLYREEN